jgi:ribonuclease P protein component
MAVRRLHNSHEIHNVFAARNAAHGRLMSVHGRRTDDPTASTRVAVVGGRDVGNAVRRNRAKRRLRAAVQHATLPAGFDFVARAKAGAVEADFTLVQAELGRLVARVALRDGPSAATRAQEER